MIDPAECDPRRASPLRRAAACLFTLLLAGSAAFADRVRAQETTSDASEDEVGEIVDSIAWQARFQEWVEGRLARPQVREASGALLEFDRGRVPRVLGGLEEDALVEFREYSQLPSKALPRMTARGIAGRPIDAVKLWTEGRKPEALAILNGPDLARDGGAIHLRAQLLDDLTGDMHTLYRLAVIDLYREALAFDRESIQADRARLRIGQIYLELRFLPEARSALAAAVERDLREPYGSSALISLAEAMYLEGDPTSTLETLARLDLARLKRDAVYWELRRRADAMFALRRYTEALDLYETLLEGGREIPRDPLIGVRYAYTLLLHERAEEARDMLGTVFALEPTGRVSALAGLALARTLRELDAFDEAVRIASQVSSDWPRSDVAALAALEAMESTRLAGRGHLALPPGTSRMIEPTTHNPARGLLAYAVAVHPSPGDRDQSVVRRLGRLLTALPEGPVRLLIQDDLTHRLSGDLARIALREQAPDRELLDTVAAFIRPQTLAENELLLAVEALALDGRRSGCVRWARVLQAREQRPLRAGLAAWRRVRCLGLDLAEDSGAPRRLLAIAESGAAGPFALAIVALAAENQIRRKDYDAAVDTYARGSLAYAVPSLNGPVLLRSGELQAALGRKRLAERNLRRGLGLTEAPELAGEPLRTAGVLALVRLHREAGRRDEAVSLLRAERARVEGWWAAAYGYLARSAGAQSTAVPGETDFARAARELDASDRLQRRANALIRAASEGTSR